MDNIFELLPFIIGILYFVFGVGKKKKDSRKPRSPRPNSQPNTSTTLEDILRELSGDKAKPQATPQIPEPVVSPYTTYEKEEKPVELKHKAGEFVDKYEHVANTGRPLKEIKEEILEVQHLTSEAQIEFDLRQAVVNEAILNRPYS